MKRLLYLLTVFFIPIISYANEISWGGYNHFLLTDVIQISTISLGSNILVGLSAILLNTSVDFLLITIIVSLIVVILFKAFKVLVSLKSMYNTQEDLLKKKINKPYSK